jgi:hypothetical protein
VIPLVLLAAAIVFGVSAGLDGRWDGRTVLAVVATVLAVLAWVRAEHEQTVAEQAQLEKELRR